MLVKERKEMRSPSDDYQRIEQVILFLEKNGHRQPGLKEVARAVHLSEYHFQRLFRRWAGISPKRFLQVLTLERAKQLLQTSGSLLDVSWQAGLSGAGRLHDLFVNIESVTPAEFRERGKDTTLRYGFHPSPFGECLIAVTERGVSNLAFVQNSSRGRAVAELREQWEHAKIIRDQVATRDCAKRIFKRDNRRPITLTVRGTNFQVKVWQALLKIPAGRVETYAQVAAAIGKPNAVRAVANAVANNPVAFLVPCHRVIRKTGALGGYHWGMARKKAMLAWESEQTGSESW